MQQAGARSTTGEQGVHLTPAAEQNWAPGLHTAGLHHPPPGQHPLCEAQLRPQRQTEGTARHSQAGAGVLCCQDKLCPHLLHGQPRTYQPHTLVPRSCVSLAGGLAEWLEVNLAVSPVGLRNQVPASVPLSLLRGRGLLQ